MSEERELVVEVNTGKRRPVVARTPLLSSARMGWQGILLERHDVLPFEQNDVSCLNHVIFLQRSAPITLEWKQGGASRLLRIAPSSFNLVPAGLAHSVRSSDSDGQFISLSIQPKFLAYAACEFVDMERLELVPKLNANDPLIEGICLTLQAEVEGGGGGGRLYSDSLANTLALHLINRYSAHRIQPRDYRGGLPKHQLRRAVEFIHEHIEKDISLQMIASTVGISPYHFARLFKRSTGLAPHQYHLRCRIERARQMLLKGEGQIADIAVRVGFCDQSHFTRHFKRIVGVTPKKFCREMGAERTLREI